MTYQEKQSRLAILRQNMANKMVAGVDYDREIEEICRLSEEMKSGQLKN